MAWSQIVTAVRKVDRLVDEREVWIDVTHPRSLEGQPVLPRRIVRVQAVDAVCLRGLEHDEDFPAPAFDPAHGARTGLGRRERSADLPWRKLLYERPYEAHRFEQLVETHRDPRRHVAARVRGHARIELLVRRNRVIAAQVVLHPARSAGEPREAHASAELRQYLPGHDEAVLRARVLVVDRPERGDLAPDRLQALEQKPGLRGQKIRRDAAGNNRVHQVAVAEELGVQPQQVLLQAPELEEAEGERDVVAQVAEVAEVVGDALELQKDAPQRERPGGRLGPGRAFDGHGVGPRVGDGGVAAYASGQLGAFLERHRLEELLDALV